MRDWDTSLLDGGLVGRHPGTVPFTRIFPSLGILIRFFTSSGPPISTHRVRDIYLVESNRVYPTRVLQRRLRRLTLEERTRLAKFLLRPGFLPSSLAILPLLVGLSRHINFLVPSSILYLRALDFIFFVPIANGSDSIVHRIQSVTKSQSLVPSEQ